MRGKAKHPNHHVWVIVRYDFPMDGMGKVHEFSVTKVYLDQDEAYAEVERLNALPQRSRTGSTYQCRVGRLQQPKGGSEGLILS